MTFLFWILCVALVALALIFVLPPLLGRAPAPATTGAIDPAKRKALEQARKAGVLTAAEFDRKLAELGATAAPRGGRGLPIALGLLLPALAFGMYQWKGEPRALDPELRAPTSGARLAAPGTAPATVDAESSDAAPPSMDQAVAGLAERMRTTPDDLDGWMLLGRAYKTMERFERSREALANAYRLAPENPDVLVEYAESLALSGDSKRIGGESLLLIQRALGIEPNHQRGLWLLGISSMQAGVPGEAVSIWERLLPLVEGSARDSLLQQIDGARERAGLPPREPDTVASSAPTPATATAPPVAAATPAPDSPAPAADAAGAARIVVDVDIDPALKSRIGASDVLFVYARAAEGPRMPLAIQRLPASSLPVRVVLDDSTSMMPALKLSTMPQVVIGARVSKSGQATPQSGDFETVSAPMSNRTAEPQSLRIDRVVP